LLREGQKVVDTLDGKRQRLSSLAEGLLERLTNFRNSAGQSDRIVLVFATEQGLTDSERRVLGDLRAMGRERLGVLFDVEAISIETIFLRLQEEEAARATERLTLSAQARMVSSGPDLLVGSIGLPRLYEFLREYRETTGDLDRIYEKNLRRFLGSRGKVNKAMQATLRDAPEKFGLYNNGITIVVHDYSNGEGSVHPDSGTLSR
jgi:AIPR protein